jgi:hypothetical protein
MSRRARITLEPEAETTFAEDTAAPEHETGATDDAAVAGAGNVAATAVGRAGLDRGTIIKTVLAGLAVVAMVLIWKNRRP